MKLFLVFGLALAACVPQQDNDLMTVVQEHLNFGRPLSDTNNFCPAQPPNANISFPRDDGHHYPGTVAAGRENFQPGTTYGSGGFESTFKFFHFDAIPVNGGAPVRIHGYRAYLALFLPPIFGPAGWYRLLMVSMVSTVDGKSHLYAYIAPDKYQDSKDAAGNVTGYNLSIGGPGDFVIDASTFAPVPSTAQIGLASGNSGTNLKDFFLSADGQFGWKDWQDQEFGRPSYPFNAGKAPAAYDPWSYYWARTQLAGAGTVTYAGKKYYAAATTWEERQWPGFGLAPLFKWRWVSAQIKGCLDTHNNKIPCTEGGIAGAAGRTIAAFDISRVDDSSPVIHDWTEVGPASLTNPAAGCDAHHLTAVNDWSTTVLEEYTSTRPTCPDPTNTTLCFHGRYARKIRLQSASRQVDLVATAVVDDQETYLVSSIYPGTWEGAVDVVGTIGGQRVWGDAFLEQFFQPLVP